MPSLLPLWILWGVVTAGFVGLWIYRSTVSMKEDDQLFLDPAEHQMEEEQKQIIRTLSRIAPYMKGLAAASVALLLIIGGLVSYPALKDFFGT